MSAASAGAFWFWFFGSVNGAVEKIIAADDRGEIEYKTFDEFDRDMKSFLKGLSA